MKAVRLIAILLLPAFLTLSVLHAEAAQPAEADTGVSDAGEALSGAEGESTDGEAPPEGEGAQNVITMVGKYDSADTAPVIGINETDQSITLKNHDTGRNYTLPSFGGSIAIFDVSATVSRPRAMETGAL